MCTEHSGYNCVAKKKGVGMRGAGGEVGQEGGGRKKATDTKKVKQTDPNTTCYPSGKKLYACLPKWASKIIKKN